MIICEKCKKQKPDDSFPKPVPICADCMRPKKRGFKPKQRPDGDCECSVCGKIKSSNKMSLIALTRWNVFVCYYCAKRLGMRPVQRKSELRCLTCGVLKHTKHFPKNWTVFGRHCNDCIKGGAVAEEMKGKI